LVIYGAGGVGGSIGARAFQAGYDVALIARGPHLAAIKDKGLIFGAPDGTSTLPIPAVAHPSELTLGAGDVVVLAMKSQHTERALVDLRGVAPDVPVVCAQNGVANERAALRLFTDVYAMTVVAPCEHLDPGAVECYGSPFSGVLDVGRYPTGVDAVADELAAVLSSSDFRSLARPDVMRWKYRKLTRNLGNIVEALCGPESFTGELDALAVSEGETVLAAAGIEVASAAEDDDRRGDLQVRPIAGRDRVGGSTKQSLLRGSASLETDYLNGEIVLLGRLHGVPTPVNEFLQAAGAAALNRGTRAGSVTEAELLERLANS
jgi:2-dehydropantoate 2-reductase